MTGLTTALAVSTAQLMLLFPQNCHVMVDLKTYNMFLYIHFKC